MRVVAFDKGDGMIQIQEFDGNLEELDEEAWNELNIQLAKPPEDWTGPYDDADLEQSYEVSQGDLISDWRMPIDNVESVEDRWDEMPSPNEPKDLMNGSASTFRG